MLVTYVLYGMLLYECDCKFYLFKYRHIQTGYTDTNTDISERVQINQFS